MVKGSVKRPIRLIRNPCSFDHFSVAEGSENQLRT